MTGSIFTEGKEYISAVRASKKIGYASDYIGQLCRAKKIPGKLIGKTWYVDYKALIEHKRHRKLGKRKIEGFAPSQEENNILKDFTFAISPKEEQRKLPEIEKPKIANSIVITYEKDDSPRLPELSKVGAPFENQLEVKKVHKVEVRADGVEKRRYVPISRIVLPAGLALVLFAGITLVRSENTISRIETVSKNISAALLSSKEPALLSSAIEWFKNLFGIEEPETEGYLAQGPVETNTSGVVVIPETDDRDGAIAKIKKVFSDEVDVSFDKSEDTGVITPVFREGDDFENYTFVLVPIEEKDTTKN